MPTLIIILDSLSSEVVATSSKLADWHAYVDHNSKFTVSQVSQKDKET